MAALQDVFEALAVDSKPAEALALLDALARAPAAAALVVAALNKADRKALRLAHTQLCDAVGEATTKLEARFDAADAARPPTPRRWPRLEELRISNFDLAALEALGSETWGRLSSLRLWSVGRGVFDAPCARALAAALRRMPALHALELRWATLSDDASAEELFRARPAPQLRALTMVSADLTPAAARALAATGWRLEELGLLNNPKLGAAGLSSLLATPTFALRRLNLGSCGLGAAGILALAYAPWPLEELDLLGNDFSAATAGPALAALSRHTALRRLNVRYCSLSAAGFKALVEAAWPALTWLGARGAAVASAGPHALGAAAFAGFPVLEELDLTYVELGKAGARLLARRRWAHLSRLNLDHCGLGDAGLAALARGAWPALAVLYLRNNNLGAPLALEDARRWAPALAEILMGEEGESSDWSAGEAGE